MNRLLMPEEEISYELINDKLYLSSKYDGKIIKSTIDLSKNYHLIHLNNIEDLGDLINVLDIYNQYTIYIDKARSGIDYVHMLEYYGDEDSIHIDDHIYDECVTIDDYLKINIESYIDYDKVMFIWGFDINTINQLIPIESHVFLINWEEVELDNYNNLEYCKWSYV